MVTASYNRLTNSKSLAASFILAGLAACGNQGTEEYYGTSLLHLRGEVLLEEEGSPSDLRPAVAFMQAGKNGVGTHYRIVDAEVSGEFPAKFELDLFEPPPADVELLWLEGKQGKVGVAVAALAAVTADHPDLIEPSIQLTDSVCLGFKGECVVADRWCDGGGECYVERALCAVEEASGEVLSGCTSEPFGDPSIWGLDALGASTTTTAECNDTECELREELCVLTEEEQCYGYVHHCPVADSPWRPEAEPESGASGTSQSGAESAVSSAGPTSGEEWTDEEWVDEEWVDEEWADEGEWEPVEVEPTFFGDLQPNRNQCEVFAKTGDKALRVGMDEYFAGLAPGLLIYYVTEDFTPDALPAGTPDIFPMKKGYNAFLLEAPDEEEMAAYDECYEAALAAAYERRDVDATEEETDAAIDEETDAAGCVAPAFTAKRLKPDAKLKLPVSRDPEDLVLLSL